MRLTQALQEAQSATLQVKGILKTAEEEAASRFRDGEGDVDHVGKKGKLDETARISEYKEAKGDLFAAGSGDGSTVRFTLPEWLGGRTISLQTGEIHPNDISQGQKGDQELWPRILEKAYAQWQGDGDITEGHQTLNEGGKSRDVIAALAGADSSSTTNMKKYNMQELARLHDSGAAITLSSLNSNADGKEGYYTAGGGQLHTGHAYWIESVDAANDKIVVRNP